MPKSLADGHIAVAFLSTKPAGFALGKVTMTEIEAGINAGMRIVKADYVLGATDSDTIDDQAALSQEGNSKDLGPSNYEGSITAFRYFDSSGKSDTTDTQGDQVYQLLKTKGTRLWIVERETSKTGKEPFATGDEVKIYEVTTDNGKRASANSGYIRAQFTLTVQDAHLDAVVSAA